MNTEAMTTEELRKAARDYDLGMNEGGEGYNPYTNEINSREIEEMKNSPRGSWEILKDLERCDNSIARECGTYDQAKVDALRKELSDLEEKEEKEFATKWTPEYTQKIREEWNAAIRACGNDRAKVSDVIDSYMRQSVYMNDLKKAVKINNL